MRDGTNASCRAPAETTGSSDRGVTELLRAWRDGDAAAMDEVFPRLYGQLRALARRHMRGERRGHTLDTTSLIHEAYLRLVEQRQVDWQSRAHFVAVASTMMRRVLVNHARARGCDKRGGGCAPLSLEQAEHAAISDFEQQVAIARAVQTLEATDPRLARVVDLRLFGGFTVTETVRYLGLSRATVNRDWRTARAWLWRALARGEVTSGPDLDGLEGGGRSRGALGVGD